MPRSQTDVPLWEPSSLTTFTILLPHVPGDPRGNHAIKALRFTQNSSFRIKDKSSPYCNSRRITRVLPPCADPGSHLPPCIVPRECVVPSSCFPSIVVLLINASFDIKNLGLNFIVHILYCWGFLIQLSVFVSRKWWRLSHTEFWRGETVLSLTEKVDWPFQLVWKLKVRNFTRRAGRSLMPIL